MKKKLFLLFLGVLLIGCSNSDNGLNGFIETSNSNNIEDFIATIEKGEDPILINVELVEVISSENQEISTPSRIINIRNEETIQSLSFHLNLDAEGNTINIAAIQYEFFEEEELKSFSYSIDQTNEDNPQLLDYTIIESTDNHFSAIISGNLSSFNSENNSYTVLSFSDVTISVMF